MIGGIEPEQDSVSLKWGRKPYGSYSGKPMSYDQMLTARFARQAMVGGGAGHSLNGGVRASSILQNSYKDMMLTNSIAAVQQAFAESEKSGHHGEMDNSHTPPTMTGGGGGGGNVIGRGEVTL